MGALISVVQTGLWEAVAIAILPYLAFRRLLTAVWIEDGQKRAT